jgi:uncharacterized protein DUF6843
MRWTQLRFWIITLANGLALCLLLLVLSGMFLALAAMAPVVESWPLFSVASLGVVLTGFGLYFTRLAKTRRQKWIGWSLHGGSLFIYVLIAIILATSWLRATRRTFLLTDGYKGDFYVIHVHSQAHEHKNHWRTTYRVSSDGILLTDDPMPESMRDEYTYLGADGKTKPITDIELSTIPDTPQSRADLTPIAFFPRTGSFTSRSGCNVQFEQVYIGTKADLLKNYKQTDLNSYVAAHPSLCGTK